MTGAEIKAALAADPKAEFALVPGSFDTYVVRIRSVQPCGRGSWQYFESTDRDGNWKTAGPWARATSAKMCAVEIAEAIVDERRQAAARRAAEDVRAMSLVHRLQDLGVAAYRASGNVTITDVDRLRELLDGLESGS